MDTTARATMTVIAAAMGACVLLAGCGSDDADRRTAAGPAASATASGSAAADGGSAPAAVGGSAATTGGSAKAGTPSAGQPGKQSGAAAGGGCPVTAETLLADLKAQSPTEYRDLAAPAGLTRVSCYNGYAYARTVPSAAVDPAGVLFSFDTATSHWRAVSIGSSGVCEGHVSKEIAAQLGGC